VPDERGQAARGDEHRIDPRALELGDVVGRRIVELGDRELSGRDIVQELEEHRERVFVRVLRDGEEEDLRVEPPHRLGEMLRLGHTDDTLEADYVSLVPHSKIRRDHDGVGRRSLGVEQVAEVQERKVRGHADRVAVDGGRKRVRTLLLGRARAVRVRDLDHERDPVAFGDGLAELAHARIVIVTSQTGGHSRASRHSMRVGLVAVLVLAMFAAAADARVVRGSPGPDRLIGTARADVLRGLAGNDTLVALGGTDFLEGGPGRDVHDAGAGNDLVAASYDGARDVVRCGGGLDVVNADLTDAVARDCELVGRRLSRDPYTTSDAQHETQVEPDSFTAGRTTVAAFQVGRRFDGAATNIGWATTTDDGGSWRSGLLPGLTVASRPPGANARASDPVVAYDAAHATWLISTLALEGATTRLTINRSPDGLGWSDAVVALEERRSAGISFDKNWATCDNTPSSPFYGRCYLVYTHSADRDMLAVTTSDDGGVTWSVAVDLGARAGVGAFPAIRPNGEIVVVYLWQLGEFSIAASQSSDGGATWAAPVRIAEVAGSCRIPDFRAFPLPSADVAPDGRVWAVWHDCARPGSSENAIFASTSADGASWAPPTAITRGRNAVLPAIGIEAGSGRVAIAYMRSRPAGIDVELVESTGTVAGFGAPKRLSAQSMPLRWMPDTTSGRMLGDYISVHHARGRPLVVWVLATEPPRGGFRQAVYATLG